MTADNQLSNMKKSMLLMLATENPRKASLYAMLLIEIDVNDTNSEILDILMADKFDRDKLIGKIESVEEMLKAMKERARKYEG